jgi:hypothetical protein
MDVQIFEQIWDAISVAQSYPEKRNCYGEVDAHDVFRKGILKRCIGDRNKCGLEVVDHNDVEEYNTRKKMLVERAAKYKQPRKKEAAEKGHGLNTYGTCASKIANCESTDSSDSETSVTETSSKSATSAKSGKSETSCKSNTSGQSVTSGFVNVKVFIVLVSSLQYSYYK